MTRWLFLGAILILGVSIVLFSSCGDKELTLDISLNDPIVLEPLPAVLGEYQGIYIYTADFGMESEHSTEFPILFRFSVNSYNMWNAPGSEDALCEPSGAYVLDIGVELIQQEEGCSSGTSDPDMNPTGAFTLMQPEDSVIMIQVLGTVRKDIRLAPVAD